MSESRKGILNMFCDASPNTRESIKREDWGAYDERMHAYTKALISGEEDEVHFQRQQFLPLFFQSPVIRYMYNHFVYLLMGKQTVGKW